MFLKEYKIEDIDYINELKEEVKKNISQPFSYKTNVKGKMTFWKYFSHESKNFEKIKDILFEYKIYEAWGNILNKGDFVEEHDHISDNGNLSLNFSGILYLTNVGPGTYFTEFNKEIKPEIGKIIIFDCKYRHLVKKYDKDEDRITIAFNGRIREKYEL